MNDQTFAELQCERFGIRNGQFYAYYRYKNLQWFLDGAHIGYGDLTDDQILKIAEKLSKGEMFEGYNEHHGTQFQQTELPMIIITREDIQFREEIMASTERR